MKEVFLEPEIEIVSFESLDQIGAGAGPGGDDAGSWVGGGEDDDAGGGMDWYWTGF